LGAGDRESNKAIDSQLISGALLESEPQCKSQAEGAAATEY
jgi:hypothetical protein